jgi:YHS domain-containing protein
MVRDPVCGRLLDPAHAIRLDYHGKPYYVCSHDCKLNFEDRPDEYVQHRATSVLESVITSELALVMPTIHEGPAGHYS